MLISIVALVCAVVGALVYILAANPKLAELGRLAYAAAMLALMIRYAGVVLRLG